MKSKFSRRKLLLSAAASVIPAAIAQARPRVSGLFNLVAGTAGPQADEWSHAGVLDLSRTPFAKLKTVPIRSVEIQEGFWSKRHTTNIESSIPSMHDELVAHGRMDNFLRLEGKSSAAQRGPVYSDSDIYKWTEAVGFALQSGARPQLHETANAMIQEVVAAQEPGGYLNTYFDGDRKPLRMLYPTQTTGHELYCVGHMLQAAIAVYRATGDRTLLDAGIRFIDDFLLPNYGPGADQKGIVAGHPEIEMALVELYRTTGNTPMSIWPDTFSTAIRAFPSARSKSRTCSAEFRSLRALILKATPCALCTPVAAQPTITLKPAIPRIGRHSTRSGKIWSATRCT